MVPTVRLEVRDPDGDQVALTVTGCSFGTESPAVLENGVANLSFNADRKCGSSLTLKATDARGALTQATVPFQATNLNGWFRLVTGTIDGEGRFRLRFKIESEDDLILTGQVVSGNRDLGRDVIVASGGVIGTPYGGRTFQLWHEAQY